MLNRRHIRVKVMQSLYSISCKKEFSLPKEEKFLTESIGQLYNLYLLLVDIIIEIHAYAKEDAVRHANKILATEEEKNPNTAFINNQVLLKLSGNKALQDELDKRKLRNWRLDSEYVSLLYKTLIESNLYKEYLKSTTRDFDTDKIFVEAFYTKIVAPNDKLYDYLEDQRLTWLDDLPIVNMNIIKRLQKIKVNSPESTLLPNLYKNDEDRVFALELLAKTVTEDNFLADEVANNTPNWDKERIADVDMVLIKMALCEFLKFPSIPVKVTINEYLEIAKEYSTIKSSIFINGILDKLVKKYQQSDSLKKSGRGLQE